MFILLALLLFVPQLNNTPADTTTISSKIEKVTVFRNQAQVERIASVDLKAGKNTIVFTELTQSLIENSIQIRAKGTFTLASLNSKFNFTETNTNNAKIELLQKEKAQLEVQAGEKRTILSVNEGEIGFLKASQNILNNNKLTGAELNDLMTTYRTNLTRLEKEKLNTRNALTKIEADIQRVNRQIREAGGIKRDSFREIVAEIESDVAQKLEFHVQYLVNNAGWRPSYDIRSNNINEPLAINFKTKIYQNTGYDWTNVKFIVNSGDPSQSIERPILNPIYAQFYSPNLYRAMQKGANIEVFNDEVITLEELVVTGYEGKANKQMMPPPAPQESMPIITQEISNQTSFSYAIERPYSVPSDGNEYTLELKRERPATTYKYSATPKLSPYAYLIGELTDWDDLNLIEGEANVYFDNSFVGTHLLNPVALDDTLAILLGKDERINIERKKLKDFAERRFFGSKTRESLSYEITIRNTKQEAVTIAIEDQIPVSTDESIKVTPKQLSGGKLDTETGIITWEMELKSNETKKLRIDFEIEYPKSKKIIY
ncbi:MAG: DUF4139 domain-containing protein [Balneolaceae bacterium]